MLERGAGIAPIPVPELAIELVVCSVVVVVDEGMVGAVEMGVMAVGTTGAVGREAGWVVATGGWRLATVGSAAATVVAIGWELVVDGLGCMAGATVGVSETVMVCCVVADASEAAGTMGVDGLVGAERAAEPDRSWEGGKD